MTHLIYAQIIFTSACLIYLSWRIIEVASAQPVARHSPQKIFDERTTLFILGGALFSLSIAAIFISVLQILFGR